MDWSKIKNIFIISFLILDLYLIIELVEMFQLSEYDVKAETESSIETRLKADEIQISVPLPKNNVQDYLLKAKPKTFTIEDTEKSILADQNVTIQQNGTMLESTLKEPLKISEKFGPNELNQFIKEHVLHGTQYTFWNKSDDGSTVTYTQQYNNKKLFKNEHGQITFYINDSNEIDSYTQTYLDEIQELSNPEKIIQPIKAIETLFNKDELPPKSKITNVELGYYTLVPVLPDTRQVLNPAWCFEIEGKGKLYVSAFEGEIVTNLNNTTEKKEAME
ncbi:two-component system regulatory protein YycI [Niallia sp. XMNu-256]|uniref:two-component system regulatory protein YycI n=1 Tax=Niallia sp. XMNu-256 TaxID=3082444 RepID=UPI0030CA7492